MEPFVFRLEEEAIGFEVDPFYVGDIPEVDGH